MIDAELLDDLNRFADLAARLSETLHAQASGMPAKPAVLTHQHADQIRDAGEVARYQAREMVKGARVPAANGDTFARADHNCTTEVLS